MVDASCTNSLGPARSVHRLTKAYPFSLIWGTEHREHVLRHLRHLSRMAHHVDILIIVGTLLDTERGSDNPCAGSTGGPSLIKATSIGSPSSDTYNTSRTEQVSGPPVWRSSKEKSMVTSRSVLKRAVVVAPGVSTRQSHASQWRKQNVPIGHHNSV